MRIAVLDDTQEDADQIMEYLKRFEKEKKTLFQTKVFYSSFEFLEEYKGSYDVIFLDIEMPGSNGLEVAREIRDRDKTVGIIFITSLAQYAIEGYEVNAIDFMVKPVGYYNFAAKLEKALRFYKSRSEQDIIINSKGIIRRVAMSEIFYIEKSRDHMIFHTPDGSFEERGSIKALKEKLVELPFIECTSGCLVNLAYVKRVEKDIISLKNDTVLSLSRRLKRPFVEEYIRYIGGGI